jgi:succinate dehydrogenase / fumarate reductase cytochrome b subunit
VVNAARVGLSVLRYRGGPNQWAWAIHRIAGLGVLLFLALHIADIFIVAFGPGLFDELVFLYKGPPARVLEIVLAFGLLYHGLNGLRITAADFFPRLAHLETARRLFYAELVVFVVLFTPAGYFMMWTLPQEPFRHSAAIAAGTTVVILAIPAVVALGASLISPAWVPAQAVSNANYDEAFARLLRGRSAQPRSRAEFNIWLFMRVSGILLIALALFHMFWLHFVISVEDITFNTIVQRWNDPASPLLSLFWRTYDLTLLAFAFTHGVLGANYSTRDYVHKHTSQRVLQAGLAALWLILIVMGAGIIFLFRGTLS